MTKEVKSRKLKMEEKEFLPSIKLLIVKEIAHGNLSVEKAKTKYGILKESTILTWLREYENQY